MEMLGVRVINGKKSGDFETFKTEDVFKIDTITSNGHSIPRFHTRKCEYVGVNTLAEYKEIFGFVQLDNGILADKNEIRFIVDYGHTLTAYFYNTDSTANVAKSRRKLYSDMIINPSFIPET